MIKNRFFGVVRRDQEVGKPAITGDTRFDDGTVYFEASRIPLVSRPTVPLVYDENRQIACSMLGYILNLEELRNKYAIGEVRDVEVLTRLYAEKGLDFLYELDGTFRIALYDRPAKRLFILADSFGFMLPVYYCESGNSIVFSTSLKRLLSFTQLVPELNRNAMHDFLFAKKCIPNKNTLIRQVQKIPNGHYLEINSGDHSIIIRKTHWKIRKIFREDAKRELLSHIGINVSRLLLLAGKQVACTVTAGYDTNIILHYIQEHHPREIKTYTIGGKKKDEIPQVLKNVANYPGVTARYAHVKKEKLDELPDLVWKLEGYLFEGGIYLMDHLGSLLASQNECIVFTGEGGDGLFSSYQHEFIMNGRLELINSFPGYFYYRWIRPIFHLASEEERLLRKFRRRGYTAQFDKVRDMNLKKMGIILNEYGVMGLHPFLSIEFRSYCRALGRKLSRKKTFYKQEVRKKVHPEIAKTLVKLGGSTDIEYLLAPQLRFLDPLLDSPLIRELLTKRERNRIRKRPEKYITVIHHLFFFFTFEKLFLSGRFDFSKESPGVQLKELFPIF